MSLTFARNLTGLLAKNHLSLGKANETTDFCTHAVYGYLHFILFSYLKNFVIIIKVAGGGGGSSEFQNDAKVC